MVTREDIVGKLEDEIDELEYKINNREEYDKKNKIIKALIKSGIAIDYALPFILAALITLYIAQKEESTPFIIDTVNQNAVIEMIDTSDEIHKQTIKNSDYNVSSIEYSTGWKKNEYGLYERTSTKYMLNENIDLNNIDLILKMDKEQLDSCFIKINSEIITERYINKSEDIYNDDTIVVTRIINTDTHKIKNESNVKNTITTLLFIIISFMLGKGMTNIKKITFNSYIQDNLERYKLKYQEIDENEIKKLIEILEIKKDNLSLIKEERRRK